MNTAGGPTFEENPLQMSCIFRKHCLVFTDDLPSIQADTSKHSFRARVEKLLVVFFNDEWGVLDYRTIG